MSLHELELAERVSDKILCINGKCVDRFGKPEGKSLNRGIFHRAIFHIVRAVSMKRTGNLELEPVKGEPKYLS